MGAAADQLGFFYGGDEFAVILTHVTLDQATKKGASLSQKLRHISPLISRCVESAKASVGSMAFSSHMETIGKCGGVQEYSSGR